MTDEQLVRSAHKEIERLRKELAEAQADTRRLNWMLDDIVGRKVYLCEYDEVGGHHVYICAGHRAGTPRGAIDAAIEKGKNAR